MLMMLLMPLLGLALMASGLMALGVVETGTNNDDDLEGTDRHDLVVGYGGDDLLNGQGGNDLLFGGSGDDSLNGQTGDDWLFGNRGNDLADGGAGNDFLSGGGGDDTLSGGEGDDYLAGIAGNNQLFGGDGNDRVSGIDIPQELLQDQEIRDELRGYLNTATRGLLSGNDLSALVDLATRTGPEGQDWAEGGAGDDTLYGDSGDTLIGGAGADSVVVHYTGAEDYAPVTILDRAIDDAGITLIVPPETAAWTLEAIQDGDDTLLRLGARDLVRLQGVSADAVVTDDIVLEQITPRDQYRSLLRFGA